MNNILVCPKCHGPLSDSKDFMECRACEVNFPVYKGVPDFRRVNPDFQPSQQEIKIRDALLSAYDKATFEQLIEIRYGMSKGCSQYLCEHQKAFELSYEQKGTSRSYQINKLLNNSGRVLSKKNMFLDIGCGSGTAVPWIMNGFDSGIGVDYSLVDLIMGSKFLEERKIANLKLVCADARKLPLPNEVCDFVNATDVIEHILPGQSKFMKEVKRILTNGGGFYFNSPNRYNIFTPESHVKVRLVGFMPRALMNDYVQMIQGVSYKTIRLLSLNELKSLIKSNFGHGYILEGPFFDLKADATDFKRKVIKQFPFLLKLINRLLLFFTTNYNVIVFKT